MDRLTILVATAVLAAAMPGTAWAARWESASRDAAVSPRATMGVPQQGRGNGGGGEQERGQGGRDDGARTERRQGGQSPRQSERGADREERGRASTSSSSRGNDASARAEERGGSSAASRGNASSSTVERRSTRVSETRTERETSRASSSSRTENGRGSDVVRAGGTTVTTTTSVETRGSAARGGRRRDRLTGQALRARIADLPPDVRRMATSGRPSERAVAGALVRGRARSDADAFDVRDEGGRVRVLSRTGALLVELDDDRARDLGAWRLRRLGDRQPTANAPAFCRSGAGHPVQGREWCLDRGFGLGSRSGTLWSRGGIDDVTWRRRTDDRLDRGGLIGVLGDVVMGRLGLQAVSLGYDQPLVGTWVARPDGPRILRVHSGDYEVAEFVDRDRDDRVDVLYVVQPVW